MREEPYVAVTQPITDNLPSFITIVWPRRDLMSTTPNVGQLKSQSKRCQIDSTKKRQNIANTLGPAMEAHRNQSQEEAVEEQENGDARINAEREGKWE